MTKPLSADLARYCDRFLRVAEIRDYDRASNGLQVENRGPVSRLAAAVDASLATVRLAIKARANFLLVHHGLFWGPTHPWTGKRYELLRLLLDQAVTFRPLSEREPTSPRLTRGSASDAQTWTYSALLQRRMNTATSALSNSPRATASTISAKSSSGASKS